MAEHYVTGFVEKGLYRESGNRADRDPPATLGVALGVAVQVLERYTLDIQRGEGVFFVPFRDDGGRVFRTLGLRQNEPMRLVREMGKGKLLFLVGAVVFPNRLGALAGQRHAESQPFLTFLYASA